MNSNTLRTHLDAYQSVFIFLTDLLQESDCDELVLNGHDFGALYKGAKLIQYFTPPFSNGSNMVIWMQLLARASGQRLDPNCASQGGELTDLQMRWHSVLPNRARGVPLFCLRRARFSNLSFEDFGTTEQEIDALFRDFSVFPTLLISGATNTGKTSLLYLIIKKYFERMRVVIAESVAELPMLHRDWIYLQSQASQNPQRHFSLEQALSESLRLRPDLLVVGEIRGSEARVFVDALMIGMCGGATIHASSPKLAMKRLMNLAKISSKIPAKKKIAGPEESCDHLPIFVVQMNSHRYITEASLQYLPLDHEAHFQ